MCEMAAEQEVPRQPLADEELFGRERAPHEDQEPALRDPPRHRCAARIEEQQHAELRW